MKNISIQGQSEYMKVQSQPDTQIYKRFLWIFVVFSLSFLDNKSLLHTREKHHGG